MLDAIQRRAIRAVTNNRSVNRGGKKECRLNEKSLTGRYTQETGNVYRAIKQGGALLFPRE